MIQILANRYMIDEDWCLEAYKKYIRPDHKVLVIPFSYREGEVKDLDQWQTYYGQDQGLYYRGIVDSFKAFGIDEDQISLINYFSHTKEEAKRLVETSHILYFPGGLPDQMMKRLKDFDLVDPIKAHQGLVIGFSAGALIQLKDYHLTPDKDYPIFSCHQGLNLTDAFYLEVHYNHHDLQKASIKRLLKEGKKPVYAIEEEGALIIEEGQVMPLGRVHCYQKLENLK